MDLRIDMHLFTEVCEAVRRGEAITFHGQDSKGPNTRVEIPADIAKKFILTAPPTRAEPAKAAH